MAVVVKENPANKPMKYEPFVLGQIPAPDNHYVPKLYSHIQATRDFNVINKDIYQSSLKEKSLDRKKTPTSVFCVIGVAGLFGAWKFVKHLFKK